MKPIFTFLFIVGTSAILSATNLDSVQRQVDSMRYVLMKSYVTGYLQKADALTEKINAAQSRDSIRYYSNQLYRITDTLMDVADVIYDHKTKAIAGFGPVMVNGAYEYGYVQQNVTTGSRPPVYDLLQKINDKSGTLRHFTSKRDRKLKIIEASLDELRKF